MTNERDDELGGLLAQAVQQLVETSGANDRPADLNTIVLSELSRTDYSTDRLGSNAAMQPKVNRSMAVLVKYSLAASLLIAAGVVTWLGLAGGTNSAYGAVAERLEKLQSIVYRVQWVDETRLVNAVAGDGDKVIHVAPSHDRIERANGSVIVIDTGAEKAIDLNPEAKTALVMRGQLASSLAVLSRGPVRLLDTLRKGRRLA